jgi:hypothetical protein
MSKIKVNYLRKSLCFCEALVTLDVLVLLVEAVATDAVSTLVLVWREINNKISRVYSKTTNNIKIELNDDTDIKLTENTKQQHNPNEPECWCSSPRLPRLAAPSWL